MIRRLHLLLALIILISLALAACGGDGDDAADEPASASPTEAPQAAGDAANGKEVYAKSCSACHGPNAEGVEGLGKSWQNNEWIQGNSDEELLAFVKTGRPPGDSENTTGVDMPPKGGNPALSDEDILDIVAYMRTLQ